MVNHLNHSLLIFSIVVISFQKVTCQRQTPSQQDCQTYCFVDCTQYFHGNEFSTCVTSNVDCSCGLPPIVRLGLTVIGAIVAFVIIGHCIRKCKARNYERTNFTGTGPIRPNANIECLSQPIIVNQTRPGLNPIAPNAPVYPQPPYYNTGVNNLADPANYRKLNNEDPPSYDEVIRGDATQRGGEGPNFGTNNRENVQSRF